MKIIGKILVPLALLAPAKLLACAACYGANIDAPMAEGMNWAIFTLGAFITTVLGGFLTFLIYAIRKSEKVEAARQRAAAAADESAAPFPLTPALSLGERETRSPLSGNARGWIGGRRSPFLLPKGEGQHEGEGDAQLLLRPAKASTNKIRIEEPA